MVGLLSSRVGVWLCCLFLIGISLIPSPIAHASSEPEQSPPSPAAPEEFVVTLDASNFTEFVSKQKFVVVEFYAPWCGHCKKLAPEFETAASILSKNDPPVILAKVDANEEQNKILATEHDVKGFPTIKILRFGGSVVQEFKGPRDSAGIVAYLKKQSGPASTEIKSAEDATALINDKKVVIVGVFPEFSGEKYENFSTLADRLRSDYDFGHTKDAKLLTRGDTSVTGPLIRLFKPFDELFIDFQEFDPSVLEKLIEEASTPIVTLFNKDPDNHPFVIKFFNSPNAKAMMFIKFASESFEGFKSKYRETAEQLKGQGISFLIGDVEASQGAFQYFGLKEDDVPLIIIQTNEGQKYLKPKVEADQIFSWVKDFKDGKLQAYKKSEPIPEANNEPVKVVVADNFQDLVYNSGKNVLLEFYAPWCGHCKKLAPILEEVAVSFQNDPDVLIAKIDATANDYPEDTFEVKGYPMLFFKTASGKLLPYKGDRTKADMIEFIQKNQDKPSTSPAPGVDQGSAVKDTKDEL